MNRLSRFREMLAEREVDAALITDELSIGYLCGYRYTDGFLLIDAKRAQVVTDFRYFEEAGKLVAPGFEVVMPQNRMAHVKDLLAADGVKTVGYESRSLPVADFNFYQDSLPFSFVPVGDILLTMRAVKDEGELARMRRAQSITDAAFSHILSVMTPHMTEVEVALELEFYMRKNGASATSFETIAVSGSSSALPHGKCRNLPLQKGFLTMDFGCIYDGYCSDMTRTVVIGKADAEMRRLYDTVKQAQEAALAFIKAGVDCAAADAVARNIIEAAGYHGAFGHGLGHSVGLFIHESPNLSPRATEKYLEVGNVVTVEPGIYLAGKYGCRIEDMGAVTQDGFEDFTASPKELIELFA